MVKPGLPDTVLATYLVATDYLIYNTESSPTGKMNNIRETQNKIQNEGAR